MKPLLIVDGYNVIGAWAEADRKAWTLDASRDKLMHLLQDYCGYSGEEVVLVYDGYQSDRQTSTEERYGDLLLVYTRHGETADSYIERLVAQTPKYRAVRVATSDGLEQSQVLATGAVRMTSRELLRELKQARQQGLAGHQRDAGVQRTTLGGRLPLHMLAQLEELRRADVPVEPPPPPKPVKPQPPKPAAKPSVASKAQAVVKPLKPALPAPKVQVGKGKAKSVVEQPQRQHEQQHAQSVQVQILPNGRMLIEKQTSEQRNQSPKAAKPSERRHK